MCPRILWQLCVVATVVFAVHLPAVAETIPDNWEGEPFVVFSTPVDEAREAKHIQLLRELLEHTADGSRVFLSVCYYNDQLLEREIGDAEERGVVVEENYHNEAHDRQNHNKFALFSELRFDRSDPVVIENVIFQSSANVTRSSSGKHQDSVCYANERIYDFFLERWNAIRAWREHHTDISDEEKEHNSETDGEATVKCYMFPEIGGQDTVLGILNHIEGDSGRVWVNMCRFTNSRSEIAERLVELREAGLDVRVITRDGTRTSVSQGILNTLRNGNVTVHHPSVTFHHKYFLVDARYRHGHTVRRRQIVFTGPQNWTGPGHNRNWESMLKIRHEPIFREYEAHFQAMLGM